MKRVFFILGLMAMIAGNANAQYLTSHAKIAMPGQQNGIYYALPRTVIQLDFIVEETLSMEGPYSDYVYMIGADEYVRKDKKEYCIQEVKINTYAEADPNATFFIAFNGKKAETTEFYLTSNGILQGVGIPGEPVATTADSPSLPKETVQNTAFKYQYGGKNMKSEEQMASSAAEMINKIREEKLKLITGFQETAFTIDTYRQMYADLDAMENDYLSLFVGKKTTRTMVSTVYVTPSKDVTTQSIGKFSKDNGFTKDLAGAGELITLQALSLKTTSTINQPSPSTVEALAHENKLFYRIPETANVKVCLGDQNVLVEKRETIAQYGVFMLAPLGKTKLALDPNTGQIINMSVD